MLVIDPDAGIPDLIRRLTDDSKRLVTRRGPISRSSRRGTACIARPAAVSGSASRSASRIVMLVALTVFAHDADRPARERSHVARRAGHRRDRAGDRVPGCSSAAWRRTRSRRIPSRRRVPRSPTRRTGRRRRSAPDRRRGERAHPSARSPRDPVRSLALLASSPPCARSRRRSRMMRHAPSRVASRRTATHDHNRHAASPPTRTSRRRPRRRRVRARRGRATPSSSPPSSSAAPTRAEIARGEYRVRLHLDQLQRLLGYGDRVDRFAVATRGAGRHRATRSARINAAAFGFRPIARATSRSRRRAPSPS